MPRLLLTRRAGVAIAVGMAAASVAATSPALAQDFPTRPLRLVVPFPPGGGSDTLGRTLAQEMGERLGQPVVVENRSGAGGNVGADAVARAAPDGHTMLIAANTFVVNPFLYRSLPFDVRRDFAAVARVAGTPMVVAAGPGLPAGMGLADVARTGRERPGSLNHGTAGLGTVTHLAAELFDARTGGRMTHVHYRGTGPMIAALVAGEVALGFTPLSSVAGLVRDGRVRLLAVTAPARLPDLPDVPTVAEAAGLEGYEADIWFMILVPAATPPAVVAKLAEVLRGIVTGDSGAALLAARGFSPGFADPAATRALIEAEQARLGPVIRAANISAE